MRRIAALSAAVVAACAAAGDRPVRSSATEPRAAAHPVVAGTALEQNAACERCHASIAETWRGSLHARSATDPVYLRAFAIEPLPFCEGCHDPHRDRTIGTGCVTCHDAHDGQLRARACADCHEFPFPDGRGKMQLTATEHARSSRSGTACAACHMPREGGHASHRFAASRDPELLRRAATITAARFEDVVMVTLARREAGHALPTGDIFRRLRVTARTTGDDETAIEVFLGRKTKLGEDRDDRPFASGDDRAEVRLRVRSEVTWSVVYERVEHPTSADETDAVLDGAIELASGTL